MVTLNTEWRGISGRQTEAMVIKLSATQSCAKHITLDGNATALARSIIESKHNIPMWTFMETIICNFQQTRLGYILFRFTNTLRKMWTKNEVMNFTQVILNSSNLSSSAYDVSCFPFVIFLWRIQDVRKQNVIHPRFWCAQDKFST